MMEENRKCGKLYAMLDLNISSDVQDDLLLETLGGTVDLLIENLRALKHTSVSVIERTASTASIKYQGPVDPLAGVRLYSTCSILLAPIQASAMPSIDTLSRRVDESLSTGLLSALRPAGGPLRFRISPLRYGRWEIRDFLTEHYGWINDPSSWDINLEVCGSYVVAQIGALYYTRRFRALARTPASTNPIAATVMINLLKVLPGQTVYDPFCGAGTLLVEVLETVPGTHVAGSDINKDALEASRHNMASFPGRWKIRNIDARRIHAADGSVERLVSNMPFGKRVGSHNKNQELYPQFAAELARVLSPGGLAVLLSEEKELLRQAIKATHSLRIVKEHMLTIGGLHPNVFVVAHRRQKM